ncbi:MAG: DUF4180 domain-containing protein [Saprospiraceae bacterium]
MTFKDLSTSQIKITEVSSDEIIISSSEDGLKILGNAWFQGYEVIILYQKNIHPDFFDLKNGMAGEILQKFSTYRIRLIIIGEFSEYKSQSLQDFIRESNKGKQVNFVPNLETALQNFKE